MIPEKYHPLLEKALRHSGGTHVVADVEAAVDKDEMQLWLAPQSIIITTLGEYPRGRVCLVFLAAGEMAEIQALHPQIEAWARSQYCYKMVFAGRKGWARSFVTHQGFRPTVHVFEKDLS